MNDTDLQNEVVGTEISEYQDKYIKYHVPSKKYPLHTTALLDTPLGKIDSSAIIEVPDRDLFIQRTAEENMNFRKDLVMQREKFFVNKINQLEQEILVLQKINKALHNENIEVKNKGIFQSYKVPDFKKRIENIEEDRKYFEF